MSGIFLPILYVISGIYGYSALNHGLSVLRRQVSRIHLLFALLCLMAAALTLARAGAYQAQTAQALAEMRRWEILAGSLFLSLFPWFIARLTGFRPRSLLNGLTLFWALIITANLMLPFGIQFTDLPDLKYFALPWGESVVDLRDDQPGFWLSLTWMGIFIVLAYSLYACLMQYRLGMQKRALSLARALIVFICFILFDALVDWRLVEFTNVTDFGFVAMMVLMDMELMSESRDQYRRMSAILDHMPVAIFVKDMQGRFQFINREFEEFFHVNNADIHGKTVFDLYPRDQADIFLAEDLLAVELRKEIKREVVMEHDGKLRILQTYRFPLLRPDGSPYAMSGVYIDITESRQKDDALNKLRRQVWHVDRVASTGALAGSLAHELSQPLSAILNNAQAGLRFMAKESIDVEEIREILGDIVRDDKRAGAVINGLRSMLQQRETPHDYVDLAQCIGEVIELLHSEFVRLDIAVDRMLETGLTVRANKTQIQQVLLNLMMNAMEAMAEQPGERMLKVVMSTLVNDKAQISICDNGTGIPEGKLERIFDGFYTTKPQGLGMGLEVCRSIVEIHHGAIWAENNPGRGATFYFTLPLVTVQGPSASSAS
jgi:two-component system, LuxR family, sensor kinase FixL